MSSDAGASLQDLINEFHRLFGPPADRCAAPIS